MLFVEVVPVKLHYFGCNCLATGNSELPIEGRVPSPGEDFKLPPQP
jgi:hypothetical protein